MNPWLFNILALGLTAAVSYVWGRRAMKERYEGQIVLAWHWGELQARKDLRAISQLRRRRN
jgi:hypothetical protein